MFASWRKNKLPAVTAITAIVSTFIAAVAYYAAVTTPRSEIVIDRQYSLFIRVIPEDQGTFIVRLPLIVAANETPTPIPQNELLLSKITEGTARILLTEKGYAFEIEADRSFSATMSFSMQVRQSLPMDYYKLSMCADPCSSGNRTFRYYGYSGSSTIGRILIYEELTIMTGSFQHYSSSFVCDGWLSGGWRFLNGEYTVISNLTP